MSFDLDDDEPSKDEARNWLTNALAIARERRKIRYAEAKEQGYSWLLECRDLWDAHDNDAGVFFSFCHTRPEVDEKVKKSSGTQKVLGIYDVRQPLKEQGAGITPKDWEIGRNN